jgi:beta-phosphoglucomutase
VTLEGVIFDFDGVIANSEPLHLRVFQALLADEGLAFPASEYYERYLGLDDVALLDALARDKGLRLDGRVSALIARKTSLFLRLASAGDVLFPGAAACLRAVAARVPIAIASGALRHEIQHVLDEAGIGSLVPVIVAAGDTARSKPAPDPYAHALDRLVELAGRPLSPGRVVGIEDSGRGLESARGAGLRTVGVATSYPAAALQAERVVPDISHVTFAMLDQLASSPAGDGTPEPR